jgi:hypothetical protein
VEASGTVRRRAPSRRLQTIRMWLDGEPHTALPRCSRQRPRELRLSDHRKLTAKAPSPVQIRLASRENASRNSFYGSCSVLKGGAQ